MVISGVQCVGLNKRFALLYGIYHGMHAVVSASERARARSYTLKVDGRIDLFCCCCFSFFFNLTSHCLPALLDFDVGSSSFCYFMTLISVDFTSLC